MVILVFGNDLKRSREKFNSLVARFKADGSVLFEIGDFKKEEMDEFLRCNSLFCKKSVIVCREILENKEACEHILNNLERFSEAENILLLFEGALLKESAGQFRKHTPHVFEYELKKEEKENKEKDSGKEFFPLCDALALRQRNSAWLLLEDNLFKGADPEDIFFKLLWQMKVLMRFKKEKTLPGKKGKKANPFFLEKIKKAAALFTEDELKEKMYFLLELFHESRYKTADLQVGIEKFILQI